MLDHNQTTTRAKQERNSARIMGGIKFNELENSCNAVPNVLDLPRLEEEVAEPTLSFTGKITELKIH